MEETSGRRRESSSRKRDGRRRTRIKWGRVLLLTGLLTSIALLVWVYFFTNTFRVDDMRVEGNQRTEAWKLEILSGLSSSDNWLTFDRARVISNLMQEPWVAEARVHKEFPNRVVLVIREREPVAQVVTAEGYCLVDGGGFIISASPTPWMAYPQLEGLSVEGLTVADTITDQTFKDEMELMKLMDDQMRARTSFIFPDPEHGMVLVTTGGARIFLGSNEDLEKKIGTAFLILEDVLRKYGRIDYVDVSSPASPVIMPL
jgi:cell division septal protein FtsQ